MEINIIRKEYGIDYTKGILEIPEKSYRCFTLEDKVRFDKPKVFGKTAIPAGRYKVIISFSNRFKKMLPEILNVPGFTGIRIHGGNTDKDTEGCILVASNSGRGDYIQGSQGDTISKLLQSYLASNPKESIYINIIDTVKPAA